MPDNDDGERSLPELISSLLDTIPNLLSFKSKWSSIRAKLTDLNTHLADISDFSANQLALDLVASVRETLNDAVSVASTCERKDLSQGKLKTQSEVDSVAARLDRHVRDAEVLIKSGLLLLQNDSKLITVPSKKEGVRSEARELVIRLQIGSTESKRSAIDSLLELLLHGDDKNVMIAVAQGVVPVLVRLLDSSLKEKSVAAISRISAVESSRHVLIAEGLSLLNHLLRVLESGSAFAKEKACVALQALSFSKENARAIGCRGGISSLLEICGEGSPGTQAFSAGVLRNLALFGENRENFLEESSVSVLVNLGCSGTSLARENAVGCLANLTSMDDDDDGEMVVLVVREGGIKMLKKSFFDSNAKSLEVGVLLLKNMASCPVVREVVISEGFISRLVPLLSFGVLGVRIAAAEAVASLGFASKSRKEIGESGCIGGLIDMLDGKAVEEKEAASKALSTLLECASNRKVFKKSDKGVLGLVQLLDPKVNKLDKRYAVSALELLVTCKKCRKRVVAAGACLHLQKLVEMDVEGAKRLAENLSRSKIWGVFARP